MPRGSQTDDDVRQEIIALYARGVRRTNDILAALEGDTRFTGRVPSERTIARILREIREGYTPEQQALDVPWQLGPVQSNGLLPHGLPPSALPLLLEFHRITTISGDRRVFTLRIARWVCALQFAVKPDENPGLVLIFACVYADRERWAAVDGKPFDTADLDAAWSFAPWRSDTAKRVYEAAVEADLVPVCDIDSLQSRSPVPPSTAEQTAARKSLIALKVMRDLAESLPEDKREEFFIFADQIIRRPDMWAFTTEVGDLVLWSPEQMFQELEELAARLRGDN